MIPSISMIVVGSVLTMLFRNEEEGARLFGDVVCSTDGGSTDVAYWEYCMPNTEAPFIDG